jgi:hypothetical protein
VSGSDMKLWALRSSLIDYDGMMNLPLKRDSPPKGRGQRIQVDPTTWCITDSLLGGQCTVIE